MAYIGTPPSNAFTSLLKQDFSTSATTGYTLDHAVNNANDIALFINFVRQEPTAAYSASGTTLTLTSATASSDDMYCVYLGQALQTVNPPNASVGLSQLTASGTKDATTFLRGDNTFASAGGVNTPYFYAYKDSEQTGLTNDADTKYQASTEGFDSDGCYNNTGSTVTLNGISTPSYSFAPNVAGKYVLFGSLLLSAAQQGDGREGALRFFKNGSALNYIESTNNYSSYSFKKFRITSEIIVDANGTSDYFHITGRIVFSTSSKIQGQNEGSYFGAYKIIE